MKLRTSEKLAGCDGGSVLTGRALLADKAVIRGEELYHLDKAARPCLPYHWDPWTSRMIHKVIRVRKWGSKVTPLPLDPSCDNTGCTTGNMFCYQDV
jgi:hypothetical protein